MYKRQVLTGAGPKAFVAGADIAEMAALRPVEGRDFSPVSYTHLDVYKRQLETLIDVGLSYIKLGQSATTLSGGEAQRVKLSKELSRRDTGRTLYILDEPTTGLHFHDIEHLLSVLHKLRDDGNTIVCLLYTSRCV